MPKTAPPDTAPAIDPSDELLTSAELAALYKTTEKAVRVGRNKRRPWLPRPLYLGNRVLYLKSEALAMLRTQKAEVTA
jgi:hypothetical protein